MNILDTKKSEKEVLLVKKHLKQIGVINIYMSADTYGW